MVSTCGRWLTTSSQISAVLNAVLSTSSSSMAAVLVLLSPLSPWTKSVVRSEALDINCSACSNWSV
jgi:hypothetical protein